MQGGNSLPIGGLALAIVGTGGMLLAGADPILASAVAILWVGSLWLSRPEPPQPRPASDNLRLSRDGIRNLIEQFSLPLLLVDRDRIIHANVHAREVLGSHVIRQDARVALRHPQAIALLDEPRGGTATIRGMFGSNSIWQMTRQPVDERYWLIELHNRTAEADISRAHTDFVANASHELRTPLASIIGYLETLVDDDDQVDAKTAHRFHETVLREALRLRSLVSDLMSLSRVEAEKHEPPAALLDLAKLTQKAATDAANAAGTDRVVVRTGDAEALIKGDRQQLEQLVRNLVDNALKYGDPEQPVDVAVTTEQGGRAQLTVTDRGEGIAAEHLPHLTRRFYRTDPGRSRAAGGTGLGLAIVKHIVERHRGRLDIDSKQGLGTTVTVRFPVAEG
jgi:two-component system phosphate regulon sensor histidine kinase PhoR